MLQAILNKSWRQHSTGHQLYGHLPHITKTILVRRTRHAGHCWRSRDELISDVLLWTPTYCRAKAGQPARTYIQQLCEDTGCSPEDLPEAMNDREKWKEMVRDIRACGTNWWRWIVQDRFWVVPIPFIITAKFKHFFYTIPSGSPSRTSHYTPFGLVFCIRFLWNTSFCLHLHIISIDHFVASYLSLLSHNSYLWWCFVLLTEGIPFFSKGFSFFAMSRFSHVRIHLFVSWNIRTVVFLYRFCFLVIFIPMMFVLAELFLDAEISLPPRILVVVSMHPR